MILAVWIVGVLAMIVGALWLVIAASNRDLSNAEAELMARDGKFEGEPEDMRIFRMARARGEAVDAGRHVTLGVVICSIGLGALLALAARGLLTGTWFY